jgi:hypothetical protein
VFLFRIIVDHRIFKILFRKITFRSNLVISHSSHHIVKEVKVYIGYMEHLGVTLSCPAGHISVGSEPRKGENEGTRDTKETARQEI